MANLYINSLVIITAALGTAGLIYAIVKRHARKEVKKWRVTTERYEKKYIRDVPDTRPRKDITDP